jgi:uncharacterized protein involved in exopolysaccharide biosynthesis
VRGELATFERSIATAPTVETEYVQLVRGYENAQNRYQDLQGKIKSASLAEQLETEAKGERYVKIREPFPPATPHSPNRLGIILAALVLGGGLIVLFAVLRDAADPTVRSRIDLDEVFAGDPVGTIPVIATEADQRRRRRMFVAAFGAYAAAAALATITVAIVRN